MSDKICCDEWRNKALGFDYEERYIALGLPGYTDGDLTVSYTARTLAGELGRGPTKLRYAL